MATITRHLPVDELFDLDTLLDGTQDFRWRRWEDEHSQRWHSGVLKGDLVHIRQVDGQLVYQADTDMDRLLCSYFRLDEDSVATRIGLSVRDKTIALLVEQLSYVRVLRHPDPWECMVAYICSANNRPERMAEIVEKIACEFGREKDLDGDLRHSFPTPDRLRDKEQPLGKMKLGLDRPSRIVNAAKGVCAGKPYLYELARPHVSYAGAKWRLMTVTGIGSKIADCIALFALDKPEAFPVDVKIRKAIARLYPHVATLSDEALVLWAQDRFGQYAGYASQLLYRDQHAVDGAEQLMKEIGWPRKRDQS